jgi:hypothetical protein
MRFYDDLSGNTRYDASPPIYYDGFEPPIQDLERSGDTLRTYRLVVAATGEYTIFHGGTVLDGMAAIVTAMNRVNQIY